MLGQPISMLIPDVVGFELTGQMREGITATDLVLQVVQMLRAQGVVGKFVEFYGSGLDQLPLADRATIANMAPEYGATCGFFPVDAQTLAYLRLTGRDDATIDLVEAYCRAQGMWRDEHYRTPHFAATLQLEYVHRRAEPGGSPTPAGPRRRAGAARRHGSVHRAGWQRPASWIRRSRSRAAPRPCTTAMW